MDNMTFTDDQVGQQSQQDDDQKPQRGGLITRVVADIPPDQTRALLTNTGASGTDPKPLPAAPLPKTANAPAAPPIFRPSATPNPITIPRQVAPRQLLTRPAAPPYPAPAPVDMGQQMKRPALLTRPPVAPANTAIPGQAAPGAPDAEGKPTPVLPGVQPPTNTAESAYHQYFSKLGSAPVPPKMDAGYTAAQAALRTDSQPTQKFLTDPNTGQLIDDKGQPSPNGTLDPRYRQGIGRKILTGVGNFLSGGTGGLINSIVNPNAPNYIGPKAAGPQYYRDEQGRLQRVAADQAKIASYEGENKQNLENFGAGAKAYQEAIQAEREGRIGEQGQQKINQNEEKIQETGQHHMALEKQGQEKIDNTTTRNQWLNTPKNYQQAVIARNLETDPEKQKQLDAAIAKMGSQQEKLKWISRSGVGKLATKNGLTADEAREVDRMQGVGDAKAQLGILKQQMQWMTPADQAKNQGRIKELTGQIETAMQQVKARRGQGGAAPTGGTRPSAQPHNGATPNNQQFAPPPPGPAPAVPQGKVMIQRKDGQYGFVPTGKLAGYLKDGARQVQLPSGQ